MKYGNHFSWDRGSNSNDGQWIIWQKSYGRLHEAPVSRSIASQQFLIFCCFTLVSVAISKTNYDLKKQKKETTARTAICVTISILLLSLRKPENVALKSFRMKVELDKNDFRLVKRNEEKKVLFWLFPGCYWSSFAALSNFDNSELVLWKTTRHTMIIVKIKRKKKKGICWKEKGNQIVTFCKDLWRFICYFTF